MAGTGEGTTRVGGQFLIQRTDLVANVLPGETLDRWARSAA